MAFEIIEKYRLYHCLSTDVKKTDDIYEGSFLFETDTGFKYIFDGVSWTYFPESIQISDGINIAGITLVNGLYGLHTSIGYRPTVSNASSGLLTIDTTATGITIVASNLLRVKIAIQNQGSSPVLLKFDGNVSTADYDLILPGASGVRLGDGGSYESITWKGEIRGITETGSSIISIFEEETS